MATITNPILTLTFLGGDLEIGHLIHHTLTGNDIVYHSISFHYQLLNGLKSSSNQITLLLSKTCSSIEDIIRTEGDIKGVLKDGTTLLFTGYLSTNYTWAVTGTGEQALSITLEDVGTRLLGKAFISSGNHFFNCSATLAISAICEVAGISVSSNCIPLPQTITSTVDSSKTCKDILEQLLYELGYVYHFDEAGKLLVFQVNCTSTSSLPTLDKDSLYVVGGKAITLGKKIRQYKAARVSFTRLGTASNYLIYRNTTGRDEGHPYCYMNLESGQYFDGSELYSALEWEEDQSNTFREAALIEACNAESEITIVGSNAILAVSNLQTNFTAQSGSVSCNMLSVGGPYITICAHNTGSLSYYITRMDAYADIIYVKDTNIVRTQDALLEEEASNNLLTEELQYVHTIDLAQAHANLLGQYHTYCNCQYTFFSKQNIVAGSIICLLDNMFSGLVVNVLITAKSYTDESEVIQYSAVGISTFNLTAEVYFQTLGKGMNDTIGPPGLPGTKGEDGTSFTVTIESSNGSVFRLEDINTTLSCRVYLNTEEITDTLDASLFQWKRTSSDPIADDRWNTSTKAIGHKTVDITPDDCTGRTVFFCEIDLVNYES